MKIIVQKYLYRERDKKGKCKKAFRREFDVTIRVQRFDGEKDNYFTNIEDTTDAEWLPFRDVLMAGTTFGHTTLEQLPDREEPMPDKKYWSEEEKGALP